MKKGFTLIEMLGVIVLLSLISIIVIMVVDKDLKDSKNTLTDIQIENIKSAAGMWRTDNIELIPDNGYYSITLGDLIDSGYIDDIVNPKNNRTYDRGIVIQVYGNDILIDLE